MKRSVKIVGVVFLVFFAMILASFIMIRTLDLPEELKEVTVNDIHLEDRNDGIYTGEYSNGLVKVIVDVHVKENKITDIIIQKHQRGLGKKAEKIIQEIIKEQSLDVDVISGATISSNVIRKAVEAALQNNLILN